MVHELVTGTVKQEQICLDLICLFSGPSAAETFPIQLPIDGYPRWLSRWLKTRMAIKRDAVFFSHLARRRPRDFPIGLLPVGGHMTSCDYTRKVMDRT